MSLQPDDAAADAFERLRSEVALLRRAVEGLAADVGAAPADYSPTLAELTEAVAEVGAQVVAISERPLLALASEQLGSLFQIAAAKVLARPVAELERERATLQQAADALGRVRQSDLARSRSWWRTAGAFGGGALAGVVLLSLCLGPVARLLPARWSVPERLAAATLDLPMTEAGEKLLRRGDPDGWEAVAVARRLPTEQVRALRDCISRTPTGRSRTCQVKLTRQ
ncbi:MAG: hypothetical protein GC203_12565 [Phenylobacterium sp.]|uniref:DUF6118 family protein n=1 Tax=Phenylobacterium sp. TaxID=1871053 RepID=UPI0025E08CB4|nr:DUF6118 family protein [Phenylobacterium sp.]MBI1198689.1 hypothetical protein [Phenylobacterium sp.]